MTLFLTVAIALQQCIAARAEKLDFSGVVSIVQPAGAVIEARGVLAGRGSPPIGAGTRFNLASAGKMFTAVAVAQLVAAGKVRLDDAIGGHVDGLKPQTAAVTVRQLLTHTSGLGNFFTPENLPAIEKARTVADLMPLVAADEPAFPPGSRVQYSNTGFLLLGRLVERVSGERYGQYLAGHVFAPAHMTASGLDPGPSNVQAVGMTARMGALRPAPEAALHGNPAGGSYSSAADLQKFFAALLGGQLKITEQRLGFAAGAFEGHRWFGHNGGAPGANVETAAFPDDGVVVVVLSNRDPPTATALFREVRAALFAPSAGPCVTR